MGLGELSAVAALLLFAANAFVVRSASRRLAQGPGFLIALGANVAVAGIAAVVTVAVSGPPATATWPPVLLFLLSGVLATYLGRRGYFRSVESLGPTRAGAVQAINPVFAALFAWLLLGQLLQAHDLAAIVIVVIGLALAAQSGPSGDKAARGLLLRAIWPALFSAVCYAAGNVARASAIGQWPEPVLGGLLAALSGTAAYSLVAGRAAFRGLRSADRRGVLLWSLAGALTVGGQILVIVAIATIPVGVAIAISSALPAIVLPVSLLTLGGVERITWRTTAGVALVVAGVAWLSLHQV